MPPESRTLTPSARLVVTLALLAAAVCLLFMVAGARGSWSFILPFRGTKLAAMILVGCAIALSTVLFQTITDNRILTPSIMGFDALYGLIQTGLVFAIGAQRVSALDPRLLFAGECAVMVLFSCLLYRWLFSGAVRSLHLLMLVGIIFGVLFRSLAGFLQRILDPNDFIVLQDRLFASFNSIDPTLLGVSALLSGTALLLGLRLVGVLDVLSLGRETAIGLGIDHKAVTMRILVIIAVLVSVSAALVGPVTFFGLLVASLAHRLAPVSRHRVVLPVAMLIAVIALVGGQTILERLLALDTALGVVIEFAGGLFFILLLMRKAAR